MICTTCLDSTLVDGLPCADCHWVVVQEYTLDNEAIDIEEFLRMHSSPAATAISGTQIQQIRALPVGQEMPLAGTKQIFTLKRVA